MRKLIQILNKYVFYDVFVGLCAVRLLLLFKVCRETKRLGNTDLREYECFWVFFKLLKFIFADLDNMPDVEAVSQFALISCIASLPTALLHD